MDFNIIRCARAVLHVTDLDKSREFYVKALGFVETDADDQHIYLRGLEECGHHSLLLKKSDEAHVEAISYKVSSEEDLDRLEQFFTLKGMKTIWMEKGTQKGVGRALRVQDISGLPIEYFASMDQVSRMLQRYDLYTGSRVQRIDHFNCMVKDVEKAHDFYIKELGFACSEYTEDEHKKIWAAWLHRKHTVHDQAFMNGEGPRIHHIGFWLPDPLALIHACDVLAASGFGKSIERGPGRHGLSNAFFLYLRDPDGHRIELYNGDYLTSDPDFNPVCWDLDDPQRQTFWGHEAPDSWFNEASSVLDIETRKPLKTGEPTLKKRKPTFVI
ncbi:MULTISPECIES: 3,4-dihydroxyphenylacetate 2,3-dioxygenase [Bacillus amyloliquefaciens group]|uniref:3,4-dihydroxyphenylacetate 2,3-dioxygenase n=1 Tax=Bacillus amyloliquefaciens group TaxID=1938374 RepID=UPI0007A5B712|nr:MULTISPECIES: 3,4-dihydroxyphenylacetate 2,3-dioxygenase [Bacillus amyloliquefaciens group]MEA1005264.1 3,4-dihydroxyphenylacetate 2,3-dioxygenase [Bacillus velezensis]RCX33883.1 3,4-dihydroxyphenylacetate 2,3-dioxygenase [Bacillus amyloliquefaciens]